MKRFIIPRARADGASVRNTHTRTHALARTHTNTDLYTLQVDGGGGGGRHMNRTRGTRKPCACFMWKECFVNMFPRNLLILIMHARRAPRPSGASASAEAAASEW